MIIEKIRTNLTPIEIFDKLLSEKDTIFLDSSDKESKFSRYSFIFPDPFLKFSSNNKNCFLNLKKLLNNYKTQIQTCKDSIPLGAACGYISYDAGFFLENIRNNQAKDELKWPLLEFGFYDFVIAYDHLQKTVCFVSTGLPEKSKQKIRDKALHRIEYFYDKIFNSRNSSPRAHPVRSNSTEATTRHSIGPSNGAHSVRPASQLLSSNFKFNQYKTAINRIKKYIEQGDVYQVNFSQRFYSRLPEGISSYELYKKIRTRNKTPFAAYMRFNRRQILSFSMERFLKIDDTKIETRPIKGTIQRGKTSQEDYENSQKLLSSKKDIAELVMITDLERNDLGRVCKYGSVKVEKLYELEKYATVFHLVSTITGELKKDKDHIDCLCACFPGGSITGAPKIRAMEIIDELEQVKRNVYCGSIGYFGFNNISDFNIAIRTILIDKDRLYFNSGGGITYDSLPEVEYEETIHKVRSFLEVLGYENKN
ncbi:MAG: aminodeoxychorismate synthase component I [Elusimicrobiota bacterium]|nr:aminodeoxychorismate synthase component I [Elusimicrobiota bacterium]